MPILGSYEAIGRAQTPQYGQQGTIQNVASGVGILAGLKQMETSEVQKQAAEQQVQLHKIQVMEAQKEQERLEKPVYLQMAFPKEFLESPTGKYLHEAGTKMGFIKDDPGGLGPMMTTRDLESYKKILLGKNEIAVQATRLTMNDAYEKYQAEFTKLQDIDKDKDEKKWKEQKAVVDKLNEQVNMSRKHLENIDPALAEKMAQGRATAERMSELENLREVNREKLIEEKNRIALTQPIGTAVNPKTGQSVPLFKDGSVGVAQNEDGTWQKAAMPKGWKPQPYSQQRFIESEGSHTTTVQHPEGFESSTWVTDGTTKIQIKGSGNTREQALANAEKKASEYIKKNKGFRIGVPAQSGGGVPSIEPTKTGTISAD